MSDQYQEHAGQPGSQKLPNPGQPGTAFKAFQAQRIHPAALAALLGPRANPVNGGRPAIAAPPTGSTPGVLRS